MRNIGFPGAAGQCGDVHGPVSLRRGSVGHGSMNLGKGNTDGTLVPESSRRFMARAMHTREE